ncbi:PTS sugar transporter subunit IIA [Evansella halocellulosilytica]|uniref:PTS sugar transporter subunit IIA n=1 Tax=Evansella halocellulosilytica TaxID=2011013 RepID=UPI000BB9639C|nr:PTS sugar transporter subunit IIA [Evansella halocellulosilytica]
MNRFGRLLSAILFQNIAIILTIGLIRVIFGEYGWFPNQEISQFIEPLFYYLLPLLIAYTGGKMVGNQRGGVIAAIVILSFISVSVYPMIIVAMFIGPLIGLLVKKIDQYLEPNLPLGMELLIQNFVAAFVASVFSIIGLLFMGPLLSLGLEIVNNTIQQFIYSEWLLLISLIIEPGKVLFFNNVMNHGILSPLGIQESREIGKSMFFMLESNPGPGIGLLTAYYFISKGKEKNGVKLSFGIHAIGGIHEVYFPYVLRKPILILGMIIGGMTGVLFFQTTGAGLVSTPSPGSVIVFITLASREDLIFVITGILISATVTFLISYGLLKVKGMTIESNEEEEITPPKSKDKQLEKIEKVAFACDAGMGSSAMGAALIRKRFNQRGIDVKVVHSSVDEVPDDVDLIVAHERLRKRAKEVQPDVYFYGLSSLTDYSSYNDVVSLVERWKNPPLLNSDHIVLGEQAKSIEDAITKVGAIMHRLGLTTEGYTSEMLQREREMSTYLGNGVAVPHGISRNSDSIKNDGIVVVQFPEGVPYEEGEAYLFVGIAGGNEKQVKILSEIAAIIENEEHISLLVNSQRKQDFVERFEKLIDWNEDE